MPSSVIKKLKKINSDSFSLSSNSLSLADDFIDTGSYALNAIISGSLYGGVGMGKVTGFSGESRCGKSLISGNIVANAQKKGLTPIIWDTEGAWSAEMGNLGIDIENCHIMPAGIIEDVKAQMVAILEEIKQNGEIGKYIFVLDSLGALSSKKEVDDSLASKDAVDMGTKAKILKSMLRQVTFKCNSAKIPLIFTNHVYDNPSQMYASVVKTASGGKGPQYMATTHIQLGLRNDKLSEKAINSGPDSDEDDGTDVGATTGITAKFKGSIITALTTKNRLAPEFLYAEMYVNYIRGLDRYAGLFEMARSLGVITGTRSYELNDGTKLGYKKDFISDYDKWEKVIMPAMEECLNKTVKRIDQAPSATQ